jgi:hypothetical protein
MSYTSICDIITELSSKPTNSTIVVLYLFYLYIAHLLYLCFVYSISESWWIQRNFVIHAIEHQSLRLSWNIVAIVRNSSVPNALFIIVNSKPSCPTMLLTLTSLMINISWLGRMSDSQRYDSRIFLFWSRQHLL